MRISLYLHAALVVFIGAFLLFVIQPITGKTLLPFFGGGSSVWTTSLVFFTGMLFAGYLYVYLISGMSPRRQLVLHLALTGTAVVVFLIAHAGLDFASRVVESNSPALSVLASLAFSIGLPFFLLATTAPLVQYWYGSSSAREPYSLYVLSNAAAFIALWYPFFIEPLFSLTSQWVLCAILFLAYAFLTAALAWRVRDTRIRKRAPGGERVLRIEHLKWVLLSALPAYLLVATTTSITKTIAPIPLLWMLPLALYILTFTIAFAGWGRSSLVPLLFVASVLAAWRYTGGAYEELLPQIISYCALLFFCSLACHALLYKMRPRLQRLPLFYVFLSLGGLFGTFAGSIGVTLLFDQYWDFALGLALSAGLSIAILPASFFPRILKLRHIFLSRVTCTVLVALFFLHFISPTETSTEFLERNFYGSTKVRVGSELITLTHGTTLHGAQFIDVASTYLPTTYYTPGSGVGRAILYEKEVRGERDLRVGTIGLGVGTIAAYCKPSDAFVFYELDPRIEKIAHSHFSYLSKCEGANVRIGDGRLTLEREMSEEALGNYDVLAIDAFSDDSIPIHLLTIEAFRLYLAHLRAPESILAVHVSNRYLNLAPIVFRAAAELKMNAILVADSGESTPAGSPSSWVLLTKDADVFRSVVFANSNISPTEPAARAWTDDYSSLLPALALPKPWE